MSPSFVAEPTGGTGKGWLSNNEHLQPSTADSGAPIEEQVGKEWDPRKSGLPTF